MKERIIRTCIIACVFGVLQYFVLTIYGMQLYPGGTVQDRSTDGYLFWQNFLSDLGRHPAWNGQKNPGAPIYKLTLSLVGYSLMLFFPAFVWLLEKPFSKILAGICVAIGFIAGYGYIGIALNPVNIDYGRHINFVQLSFITFCLLCLILSLAIYKDEIFPNKYAYALWAFCVVLTVQIAIMILGPRSWHSDSALRLQVLAQKIIVYAQMFTMLYLARGCFGILNQQFKKA